jgi:hypothetical protein
MRTAACTRLCRLHLLSVGLYWQCVSLFYVPVVTVLALDRSLDCVAAIDRRSVQCSQQLDISTAQYEISSPSNRISLH